MKCFRRGITSVPMWIEGIISATENTLNVDIGIILRRLEKCKPIQKSKKNLYVNGSFTIKYLSDFFHEVKKTIFMSAFQLAIKSAYLNPTTT